MIVDPVAKPPQKLWREQTERWLNPSSAPPIASFDLLPEDRDPDPPPAASAACWPRVFPGL